MKPEDAYEQWKASRRDADVPAGFADRVMERVGRAHRPAPAAAGPLWLRRAAAAAAVVGATVVWGYRVALLAAALLASN